MGPPAVTLALCVWLSGSPSGASQVQPPPATSVAELQQHLAEHIRQPKFAAATWGVKVISLDTGRVVFEENAQKYFSPASNTKLYTVALALDRLGADYRIRTSLYAPGRPAPGGVIRGDLTVFGRGDPGFTAHRFGNDLFGALVPLVRALTNAGVRHIEGDLVGDESFFRGPPFGSGWDWDDTQFYYGAPVSALTINDNRLEVTVKPGPTTNAPCVLAVSPPTPWIVLSNRTVTAPAGSGRDLTFYRPLDGHVVYVWGRLALDHSGFAQDVTVPRPAGLFVTFLREALARAGVTVRGRVRAVDWLDRQVTPLDRTRLVELGAVESAPLRELASDILKPSQNLYTDLLLAHVGEMTRPAGAAEDMTSEAAGIRELERFLAEAGIPATEVQFEEGSGLSRNNLTTPNATVALLRYMSRHREATTYLAALPVAGVDGTLRNRMRDTPAAGNVRAKTGTLRWAHALSGYVTTAAGERLAFCAMLNRYRSPNPERSARDELDAIAVMLARFQGRTAP